MLAAFTVVKLHDPALGKRIRQNSKMGTLTFTLYGAVAAAVAAQ